MVTAPGEVLPGVVLLPNATAFGVPFLVAFSTSLIQSVRGVWLEYIYLPMTLQSVFSCITSTCRTSHDEEYYTQSMIVDLRAAGGVP